MFLFMTLLAAANPCDSATATATSKESPEMTIRGRLLKSDAKTPASGVAVYAYHTDKQGEYGKPLKYTYFMKTDAKGEFILKTIVAGPYPGQNIKPHVHFQFWGNGVPQQWAAKDLEWTAGQHSKEYNLEFIAKPKADNFEDNIRHGLAACGL